MWTRAMGKSIDNLEMWVEKALNVQQGVWTLSWGQ